MDWYKILQKHACRANIEQRDKDGVLKELADIASKSSEDKRLTSQIVYEALSAREKDSTTAFGDKIAIPHAAIEGLDDFFVFIVSSRQGVDFESLDGKKVHLFFVILGPKGEENQHLKILAAISRITHAPGIVEELMKSDTSTSLYESFLRSTWSHEHHDKPAKNMKAMFVVLYLDDLIYDILELFLEEDVDGATIVDSVGMGDYISNIPLFASFMGFMNRNKHNSKTIMALVPEHKVEIIVNEIEKITGNLDNQEGAMVFTLNIDFFKGSMKMI